MQVKIVNIMSLIQKLVELLQKNDQFMPHKYAYQYRNHKNICEPDKDSSSFSLLITLMYI